ncbi:MAG: carbonic anhydrase [Lentisphaerae bacterium GWF2_45_14]|nr:MAG: carbonic anhydrase [Lentisphaerae bacterium GWF2_45_14]
MKLSRAFYSFLSLFVMFYLTGLFADEIKTEKPSSEKAVQILKDGNERFVQGQGTHPHSGMDRVFLANKESQAKYAYATILSCSDSRVPPEIIFDTGIMDIFVIRIAGNISNTDEAASIEYGLFNVKTPLLIILGHSQCGAVSAVVQAKKGHAQKFEKNIPSLVDFIKPSVKRVMDSNPNMDEQKLLDLCVEENVCQSFENLFIESPATRELVKSGKIKALGAIYDLSTGRVNWLSEGKVMQILDKVE